MSIQDTLEKLASCLCAQIETDGLPAVCFCGLAPGAEIALDYQGDCPDGVCGMAWVRLATAYPATALGNTSEQPGNCAVPVGFDVEIGIVRCASLPDEDGSPPSEADLLADTQIQVADMLVMRRAVVCCVGSDHLLRAYTPIGPDGGVVGGVWAVSLMED
jgi:hypothetical protein